MLPYNLYLKTNVSNKIVYVLQILHLITGKAKN